MKRHFFSSIVIVFVSLQTGFGQVLPLGMPALEDKLRRDQLMGKLDSTISFSIRPLNNEALLRKNMYDTDDTFAGKGTASFLNGEGRFQLQPIVWENQVNTVSPYGWNDGPMIPAAGYQTFVSAGFYAEYKWFSIQLRPEFVFAQNKDYPGYNGDHAFHWSDNAYAWDRWYRFANNIDMPERFGEGRYTKLLPGQSSVRFNYGVGSLGVSTENLWWGPGRRNSLLMSNNAPGFLHITLNTRRPIQTGIGSFEGQLIAGRLEGSGFPPKLMGNPDQYDEFYNPKRDDWRYLSGIVLSYQPKWLPGLFIGLTRSHMTYSEDLAGGLNSYLPMLGPGSISPYGNPENLQGREERMKRDAYGSIFARWLMPKGNAEIYMEYGRTDPPWDARDRNVSLDHSRAFIVGFNKLIPLSSIDDKAIQVGVEVTQLEATRTSYVRNSPSWYTHDIVRHGYTHRGQVLGAGIGPGSNLQSLEVAWVNGVKRLGLQVERFVRQSDFFYAFSKDYRRRWVDLGLGIEGVWNYHNFIFSGKLHHVHAHNYQYELEIPPTDWEGFWDFLPQDRTNMHLRLGVMYRF